MDEAILSANPACNQACRACHYKDLDYPAQLARKQQWAERQLARFGAELRGILPAPEPERLGYRAKTWLRSHFEGGDVSFGMFRAVQGETRWEKEFISWNTCPLHTVAIQKTTARLRNALAESAPDFAANALFGAWFGTPHLVLIARENPPEAVKRIDWSSILEAPITRVWFHQTNQVGKSVFGEGPILPLGSRLETPSSEIGHPIRAFRQIAQTLLTRAREDAARALLRDSPSLVVDLYCGTGELARLLPAGVGWLGIETGKEAVTFANGLRPEGQAFHRAYLGLIEQRLRDPAVLERIAGESAGSYALYINPPRPGLGSVGRELVLELIRKRSPTSIVYLSCSASSLARDLDAFESTGFRPSSLQPLDFFPQTEHFETLAILDRV